jgi:hypothetical protein
VRFGATIVAVCALLAACSHTPPAPPAAPTPVHAAALCDAPVPADRKPVCDTLARLNERPLPDEAWRAAGGPVARVVIMPAGQPVLAIRVIGGKMTVKRLMHGTVDVARVVELSQAERQGLIDSGAKAWPDLSQNADAPTFAACKTANYVVAESNLNGDGKFAVSHCVALRPLRDLADAYLNLASKKVPELDRDLEQSLD